MALAKMEQVQYAVWRIESLRDYIELLEETLQSNKLAIFRGQAHDWPTGAEGGDGTLQYSLSLRERARVRGH